MLPAERKRLLSSELNVDQWKRVFDYLYDTMKIRLFTLIGGEPAVKHGVEEIITHINTFPGAVVVLLTSGIPLLRNRRLLDKLIAGGLTNITVSVDGASRDEDIFAIDVFQELRRLTHGSARKSLLGQYFLRFLTTEYANVSWTLGAGCIVNKHTLDKIMDTYKVLSLMGVYLNLCPEQTLCIGRTSNTALDFSDRLALEALADKLVAIKESPGNFLMPSRDFLSGLPDLGIRQSHKCSEASFPSTLHIHSGGVVNFCAWRAGYMVGRHNIWNWVTAESSYEEWLRDWRADLDGQSCSCSWTFLDRTGDFSEEGVASYPNLWFPYTV